MYYLKRLTKKSILIYLLLLILLINLIYLYLGVSCKNLSIEQQCLCYDLKQKNDIKFYGDYLKSCSNYRVINE